MPVAGIGNCVFNLNLFPTHVHNRVCSHLPLNIVIITVLHDPIESDEELLLWDCQHNAKVVRVFKALK